MLSNIKIWNIALIDYCDLNLFEGLNVLSGETGSGKSIVIDSLNFVFGARADKSLIKAGEKQAKVEAVFCDVTNSTTKILEGQEIAFDEKVILFRTMDISGKNECRINGAKVTIAVLKQVAMSLIDMHGQHENQKLMDESKQMEILDGFIGVPAEDIKKLIANKISEINTQNKIIKDLGGSIQDREQMADFLRFQVNEIEFSKVKQGELEDLISKRDVLQNKQKIFEAVTGIKNSLGGEDSGALQKLADAAYCASSVSNINDNFKSLHDRLVNSQIEIEDILNEFDLTNSEDENESMSLDNIIERIFKIKNIFKKYGDFDELEKFVKQAKMRLEALENSEEVYAKCLSNIAKYKKEALVYCEQLLEIRSKFAEKFERQIVIHLQTLGMKNAKFVIEFTPFENENFNKNGNTTVSFLFSANLGQPLKELSKIASGGEISRLSLAIKTITAENDDIPSMIFDEIDTGISGAMGQIVAQKMAIVSKNKQVVVVSHLPQICAMGDFNYLIEKFEDNVKTITSIKLLSGKEKVDEVSRLSGGSMASTYSNEHANELILNANIYKKEIRK